MRERKTIVDKVDGGQLRIIDFHALNAEELRDYVALGYEGAIEELLRRDPRAGQEIDPNAPVQLPET